MNISLSINIFINENPGFGISEKRKKRTKMMNTKIRRKLKGQGRNIPRPTGRIEGVCRGKKIKMIINHNKN